MKHILFLLMFALLILVSSAHATLISTFDTGNEGWSARTYYSPTNTDPPLPTEPSVLWDSSNGHPDGYIYLTDPGNGSTQFKAPDTWLGDWTSYIGGTFEFDLKVSEIENNNLYQVIPNIIIHSGDVELLWREEIIPQEGEWTHFEVIISDVFFLPFNNDGRSFEELMSNVTEITVRGESFDGYDVFGIDNVKVSLFTEPTIDAILEFFDESVAAGTINGRGRRPWLANARLWIFGQMLESAKWLLEHDRTKHACKILKHTYNRCDGARRPPDFVKEDAVPELANMISELMCSLECKGCPIKYTAIINYYKEGERSWIEIQLVDEDGNPMAHEKYELYLPDGSVIEGTLDENGIAQAPGVEPGTADIDFPDLDTDSWQRI